MINLHLYKEQFTFGNVKCTVIANYEAGTITIHSNKKASMSFKDTEYLEFNGNMKEFAAVKLFLEKENV